MTELKTRIRNELDFNGFKSVSLQKALRLTEVVLKSLDYELKRKEQYISLTLGTITAPKPKKEKKRGAKKNKSLKSTVS
jgi:hypothetical protein